jgi:2-polyprenyl-3-methyl-5-hydroxy-6-metoxy-1,4-benzoquinol methylase
LAITSKTALTQKGQKGLENRVHATIPCPLCGAPASFYAKHPEAELYRCPSCTHCFTQLTTQIEEYRDNYFYEDHRRWFESPNFGLFEWIAAAIPQGASVLDAGCGRGDFLRHLRKIRPDLSLTGIDLSANKDADGIRYYQADLLTMSRRQTFDVVVSLAVIEHVTDVRAFVDRLRRFTNPGGSVVIMTLNDDSLVYRLARMGRAAGVPLAFNRVYSRHHLHHFTRRSLRGVLENYGLKIESDMVHNAPMGAIDIPVKNFAVEIGLLACLAVVFVIGGLTGTSTLQTVICRAKR